MSVSMEQAAQNALAIRRLRDAGEFSRNLQTLDSRECVHSMCAAEGCSAAPKAPRGFCWTHYRAWLLRGDSLDTRPPRRHLHDRCTVEGCGREHEARGLCRRHYSDWLRRRKGKRKRARPYGSGMIRNGYRFIFRPEHPNAGASGMLQEHRHVMSQMLGRPLLPSEEVHHRNGDRGDNRPENLELWTTKQPKGQRVEDKVAWAKEILSEYRGEQLAPDDVHYW